MQFVHPSLTWGFLLVSLPLLIHLINLVRRRRIRWAAMEFLLQSYRKHRTWIWLKQLLLLAARMAAVALLVAMLAQWVSRQQWLSGLGGSVMHHYVLLDDSYSMSERVGASSPFEQAKQVLGQIASQAMARPSQQKFTLIRFSRAAASGPSRDDRGRIEQIADLHAEVVDANFDLQLEDHRRQLEVTQLAVGPRAALELLNQVLPQDLGESNVVHLLSDFRQNAWGNPAELRRLLQQTARYSEAIHLVRCAKSGQANLAISELWPGDDIQAAGVPLFVQVRVKNFSAEPARRVPVKVRTVCFDPREAAASEPGQLKGKSDEPPAALIEEIPPGGTATCRVQVYFPHPGSQVVESYLPDDPVVADSHRFGILHLTSGEPVLVIDNHPQQRHAYYLAAAFDPGQRARSGVRPEVQPVAFLRDASAEDLRAFRAIYLLDLNRLDDLAVENLEAYVASGGGVAFFLGAATNVAFFNEKLYRDGQGLFPLPLQREDVLPERTSSDSPDLLVENHPIFSIFLGERNPFVRLVTVERYWKTQDGWVPGPGSTTRVLARLRNRQPLAVERFFGSGRVVAFLSTLAPDWNNWAQDPSFVVVLLRLQAHLADQARRAPPQLVGTPLHVPLDLRKYRKDVVFVRPGAQADRSVTITRTAIKSSHDANQAIASLGQSGTPTSLTDDTQRSGVYEAWSATLGGPFDVRRFALNVDPDEGDLTLASTATLRSKLEPVPVVIRDADEYVRDAWDNAGHNRSLIVMVVLLGLLLSEQLLAYSASYHPARAMARSAAAGARSID